MKNKTVVSSCDICQMRANGRCSQLTNELSSDFRAAPLITSEEKVNWPTFGSVFASRERHSPYIREKFK